MGATAVDHVDLVRDVHTERLLAHRRLLDLDPRGQVLVLQLLEVGVGRNPHRRRVARVPTARGDADRVRVDARGGLARRREVAEQSRRHCGGRGIRVLLDEGVAALDREGHRLGRVRRALPVGLVELRVGEAQAADARHRRRPEVRQGQGGVRGAEHPACGEVGGCAALHGDRVVGGDLVGHAHEGVDLHLLGGRDGSGVAGAEVLEVERVPERRADVFEDHLRGAHVAGRAAGQGDLRGARGVVVLDRRGAHVGCRVSDDVLGGNDAVLPRLDGRVVRRDRERLVVNTGGDDGCAAGIPYRRGHGVVDGAVVNDTHRRRGAANQLTQARVEDDDSRRGGVDAALVNDLDARHVGELRLGERQRLAERVRRRGRATGQDHGRRGGTAGHRDRHDVGEVDEVERMRAFGRLREVEVVDSRDGVVRRGQRHPRGREVLGVGADGRNAERPTRPVLRCRDADGTVEDEDRVGGDALGDDGVGRVAHRDAGIVEHLAELRGVVQGLASEAEHGVTVGATVVAHLEDEVEPTVGEDRRGDAGALGRGIGCARRGVRAVRVLDDDEAHAHGIVTLELRERVPGEATVAGGAAAGGAGVAGGRRPAGARDVELDGLDGVVLQVRVHARRDLRNGHEIEGLEHGVGDVPGGC